MDGIAAHTTRVQVMPIVIFLEGEIDRKEDLGVLGIVKVLHWETLVGTLNAPCYLGICFTPSLFQLSPLRKIILGASAEIQDCHFEVGAILHQVSEDLH